MSEFPYPKILYGNPLISFYNPWKQQLNPTLYQRQPWSYNSSDQPSLTSRKLSPYSSSFSISVPARIKALRALRNKTLKCNTNSSYWLTQNTSQRDLLAFFDSYVPSTEIDGNTKIALSKNQKAINEFLASSGQLIPPQLDWYDGAEYLNIAILNELNFRWAIRGSPSKNKTYFALPHGTFKVLYSRPYDTPIIQIKMMNPDIHVFLEPQTEMPYLTYQEPFYLKHKDPYELVRKVIDTRRKRGFFRGEFRDTTRDFGDLWIPYVNALLDEDVSHMNGLKICNGQSTGSYCNTLKIKEVVQKTQVSLDEMGLHSHTSFGATVKEPFTPSLDSQRSTYWRDHYNPFIMDRPFLMLVEHQFRRLPLFIGYFNTDVWKP